ncbi:MAG: peptidoglycan DD-metalloendopeptidase family protein [Lachnospiraceae bacterium]|nr:peptidoglycan DD-metalloendopeptidase family protein [Lachnospiraceae bacterium]
MKKITKFHRQIAISYLKTAFLVMIVSFFLLPNYIKVTKDGNTIYTVFLNGRQVGTVSDVSKLEDYLVQSRRELEEESDDMVFVDTNLQITGEEKYFGLTDSKAKIKEQMLSVLKESIRATKKRAYTLKINEFTVNLASSEEVRELLQAAIHQYDTNDKYQVELVLDPTRELSVLTASIKTTEEKLEEETFTAMEYEAGVGQAFSEMMADIQTEEEKEFSDYELGLMDISYGDDVEIVETYLTDQELTPLNEAIDMVTKNQETQAVYEVVSGDTLSEIALKTNLPMDAIIEMNENLEDENSTIRVGDELVITVPEPELSVERKEEVYYEEDYEADIEYVYNDEWYTTESQVLQQPSAGHRKVVSIVSYRNEDVTDTEILKEEVSIAAVPKIVEIGTKVPPTYIKPISGGRFTSGFKIRWGRWHKGVDWATPVGTAVMASSGGTVAKAGWGSGYGYVVYINHADGRQTRYGHLSKVLVKPGDYVKQGQKIALSGNTGRSTGPHVHFEILIGGTQVDPLKYMN